MAILLPYDASEFSSIYAAGFPHVGSYPITLACWFKTTSGTTQPLVSIWDDGGGSGNLHGDNNRALDVSSGFLRASEYSEGGGSAAAATSSTIVSAGNEWCFGIARFGATSSNLRVAGYNSITRVFNQASAAFFGPTFTHTTHTTIGSIGLADGSGNPQMYRTAPLAIAEVWMTNTNLGVAGDLGTALFYQLAYRGPFSVPHVAKNVTFYLPFVQSIAHEVTVYGGTTTVVHTLGDSRREIYSAGGSRWEYYTTTAGTEGIASLSQHPPLFSSYVRPTKTIETLLVDQGVVFKDWVEDFGMIPNDSSESAKTSNHDAIVAWKAWAQAQNPNTVRLRIPPGEYYVADINDAYHATHPFAGINNLFVSAYGATFKFIGRMTGGGYVDVGEAYDARVYSVYKGDTSLIVKDIADLTKYSSDPEMFFAVGKWCMLNSNELQDGGGYPPNWHNMQFVQITGIDGDVVSFTPAAKYDYHDYYPFTTAPGTDDAGGPASLYPMGEWDTNTEVRGLTWSLSVGADQAQIYCPGRIVKLVDCDFVGCVIVPTMNMSFTAINCTTDSYVLEFDKNIELAEFEGGEYQSWLFQSSSVQELHMSAGTTIREGGYITGTARRSYIDNCEFNCLLNVGAYSYGGADSLEISNSTVQGLGASNSGVAFIYDNVASYSNGLIRLNIAGYNAAVTGLWWLGLYGDGFYLPWAYAFNVYDIVAAYDELGWNSTVLLTDLPDPLPPLPNLGVLQYIFHRHPMPSITATNMVGDPDVSTGPDGLPIFSHSLRSYYGNEIDPTNESITLHGKINYFRINVIRAYTGVRSSLRFFVGNFRMMKQDFSGVRIINLTVDAKIAGERVVTPPTATGEQSGDGWWNTDINDWAPFTDLVPMVSCETLGTGYFDYDVSGEAEGLRPIIEVEVLCDQVSINVPIFVVGKPIFSAPELVQIGYQVFSAPDLVTAEPIFCSEEASLFIDRTTGLDHAHIEACLELIDGLVIDNVWNKLDVFYVLATQNAATAALNLVNDTYAATFGLGNIFTADQGVAVKGAVNLELGFNAVTAGGNYSQNSAHLGVWIYDYSDRWVAALSLAAGDGPYNEYIFPNYNNEAHITVNDNTDVGFGVGQGNPGFYLGNRSSSTVRQGYYNNTSLGSYGTSTSRALTNSSFITVPTYINKISAYTIGGSLTPTQATALYNRLSAYMTAIAA